MNQWASLADLVAARAARTPDATAVVAGPSRPSGASGPSRLSYAELDAAANRLAHHLVAQGVGPSGFVGVCLPRRVELVVALLAAWRAGAPYLPVDPTQPELRRRELLRDAGVAVLITCAELSVGGPRVCVDRDRPAIAEQPATSPDRPVDPDGAAYAVYTSGSTGLPKAAVVTHAGIANRVDWAVRRFGLSAADRVLQKTPIGFDAACWEFFAPLVSGGTVVLAPAGAERDPAALVGAVLEHDITVLQGVPSVLRLVAAEPDWPRCHSLRVVCSAGEPLHAELAQLLLGCSSSVELWNTYGPTECAIDVAAHRVDPAQTTGPVPIGRPLDNTRLLVLDPDRRLVPVGVTGELYVGGVPVGLGYLGRSGLTADRFVPDGYGPPGARLYRTGDRVRWRADRTLEFVGRVDDQVKVNGVRIEPAEVEAALAAHPAVHAAAVTPFRDATGERRLAGFVVADPPVSPSDLRPFLAARLPEAMIPAVFPHLDALPLTPSGKLDRAALPDPTALDLSFSGASEFAEPATPAERTVAAAWCDLLGVDRVGRHDDFFALGGSSLMLARLAGRLGAAAGGAVPLHGLISASTVAAQAALLDTAAPASAAPAASTASAAASAAPTGVVPVGREGALVVSAGQRRLWFLDRLFPGSPEWVAPLFCRLPAALDTGVVRDGLRAVQARHEILRTRYRSGQDGDPRQVVEPPGEVELRVVDLPGPDRLVEVFAEQLGRGFDLERGPVWRALLVRLPGQDHVLLATVHHIASDAHTATILERDLREICAAFAERRAPVLPPLPVQYADHAAWQRTHLTDDLLAGELDWWRRTLADLPQLELPTDRLRPAERDPSGSGVRVDLPAGLATALTELGRRCSATPFMVLLTALSTLLARYAGQWDVPVGTLMSGRGRPEVEQVAGLFVNPVVLRCRLRPEQSFADAVRAVRDTTVSAFAHHEVPFERIVEELATERDLSRTALFQVVCYVQEGLVADPLAMDAFQRASRVAKTDLSLFLWPQPDGAILGAFEYATALFDERTVRRMADHLLRLLAGAVAAPDTALADLELLSPREHARLTGWNDTAVTRPPHTTLDRFETVAAATPTATALRLVSPAGTVVGVDYAALDRLAEAYAHRLRAAGVRRGAVVGLLLDRGADLVAAMLGIWKAGAAYLPFDPGSPPDRIDYMLRTAGATVAVTSPTYADRFTVPLVLTRPPAPAAATAPAAAPVPPGERAEAGDLAYVMFTSGSTGRPKGVLITHGKLANYVACSEDAYVTDRGPYGAPLFSSVAFDMVVPNLWVPLAVGQPVTLLPADLDLPDLGRLLAATGPFNFVKLTPGHLEVLTHQLDRARAVALTPRLVVGAEAFPPAVADHWLDLVGPGVLLNEYGPTEASVAMALHPVDEPQRGETVPIGHPTANATMHVLDANLRPVPVGVLGELFIGGDCVALGYVGRPDLTAAAFLPDPFGPPGARFYRTGDVCRRLADGSVDFLGRVDDQAKIRGYRVEPAEVRAVLEQHPDVRAAVVLAHRQQLVAFHVGGGADLAEHCAARLADYLVPSVFVPLDRIPLNPNGKIDRAALLDVLAAVSATVEEPVPPRDVVEERVADVWTGLLGAPAGVRDNFFTAGGHSILAVRLISELQETFELDLPLRLVFERPTVEGLADAVRDRIRAEVAALSGAELAELDQQAAESGQHKEFPA